MHKQPFYGNYTGKFESVITPINIHTYIRLTALCPGLPRWAGTRNIKQIWILLEQETVSGSGISCAICKSAPHTRQITMSAPYHSVFYRPDTLPAAQPTASKHWRHNHSHQEMENFVGTRYYCPHALADSKLCIWNTDKMLASPVVLRIVYTWCLENQKYNTSPAIHYVKYSLLTDLGFITRRRKKYVHVI